MSWWVWVLLAWITLSLPVAILVGRLIREGHRQDGARLRQQSDDPPALPKTREEDRSA